jgi:hypothetical protein
VPVLEVDSKPRVHKTRTRVVPAPHHTTQPATLVTAANEAVAYMHSIGDNSIGDDSIADDSIADKSGVEASVRHSPTELVDHISVAGPHGR